MKHLPVQWILAGVGAVLVLAAPVLLTDYPYWLHVAIVAYFSTTRPLL